MSAFSRAVHHGRENVCLRQKIIRGCCVHEKDSSTSQCGYCETVGRLKIRRRFGRLDCGHKGEVQIRGVILYKPLKLVEFITYQIYANGFLHFRFLNPLSEIRRAFEYIVANFRKLVSGDSVKLLRLTRLYQKEIVY